MDLRSVMRGNPGDTELLKSKIIQALQNKPERHYFDPDKIDIVRFMNMTGGWDGWSVTALILGWFKYAKI